MRVDDFGLHLVADPHFRITTIAHIKTPKHRDASNVQTMRSTIHTRFAARRICALQGCNVGGCRRTTSDRLHPSDDYYVVA